MRILILALLCPLVAVGQNKIDAETFFAIGMAKTAILPAEEKGKINFPWIEKYDIRTETRDLDPDNQEYTLRLSPASPGRRKALKGAYEHIRSKPDFEGEEAVCETRMDVHLDWLVLFVIHQQLVELINYERVLKDKQVVMEKLVGTYKFDVKNLVTLEMDKNDLSVDIYDLQQKADRIASRYGLSFSELDFENFIEIDNIINRLFALRESQIRTDPELSYKKEQIQRELALERSENKQYLDFLQLRYRGPHTDLLRERISIGLGFNILNSGDRKLKVQELELEQDQLEREATYKEEEKGHKLAALIEKVLSDKDALDFQEKIAQQEREKLASIAALITKEEGFDPLLLLDMEERKIKVRLGMLQKQESIYLGYLNYLDVLGEMCVNDQIFLVN